MRIIHGKGVKENEEKGTLLLKIYDQRGVQGIQVKGGSVAQLYQPYTRRMLQAVRPETNIRIQNSITERTG